MGLRSFSASSKAGKHAMAELTLAPLELILGGQKSGKSRRAEALAQAWLSQSPGRSAMLVATAQGLDNEMRARIEIGRAHV